MNDSLKQNEQVNVSLDVVWHGIAGIYDARMGEISLDGCFIDSNGQEVVGETINFKVRLPSGIWVTLEGEVIAQKHLTGFKVRFTNLTPENQKLVSQVVASHDRRQAPETLKKEDEKATSVQTPQGARRILVADDEAMTLLMLTAIIESQGYKVVSA